MSKLPDTTTDTLDLAQSLIKIDSSCRRSNVEIIDYLQGILETSRFEVERLVYTDPKGELKANLVARKGTGNGGFGIFCHSDTVPAGEGDWEPFDPKIEIDFNRKDFKSVCFTRNESKNSVFLRHS